MAVKMRSLRVDTERERQGEWVEFPEYMDEQTGEVPALLVRGGMFGPYQAALSQLTGQWQRKYYSRNESAPPDEVHRAQGRLYADHILLGWRGFAEPYEPEGAREWLLDPESRPTHELIRIAMTRVGRVEAEFVQDAAKNSPPSSAGSSKVEA